MKSQDVVLLLKIVSLELAERRARLRREQDRGAGSIAEPFDWQGWQPDEDAAAPAEDIPASEDATAEPYSVRGLAAALGINKNEVSASLRRSMDADLVRRDRDGRRLRANAGVLLGLAEHCLRYVFPVKPGPMARGIPTGFAAPILADEILSAGELIPVWPYARGNRFGQGVTPLYRSVPLAVQRDPDLYAMLALVDALRLGNPRERSAARERLGAFLGAA